MIKPSIFIGSSSEALRIASQVQYDLRSVGRPKLWNQGVFGLGWGTLEALIKELSQHDFAILVLSPDDRSISREVEQSSPRDNVIFELGLFMGRLGRERAFVLYDKSASLKLLSDLAGITIAEYDGNWANDDLPAAIGAACQPIREAIGRLRSRNESKELGHETISVLLNILNLGAHAINRANPEVRINARYFQGVSRDGRDYLVKQDKLHIRNAHLPDEFGLREALVDEDNFVMCEAFKSVKPIYEDLEENHLERYGPRIRNLVDAAQRWVLACPVRALDESQKPHGVIVFFGDTRPIASDSQITLLKAIATQCSEAFESILQTTRASFEPQAHL